MVCCSSTTLLCYPNTRRVPSAALAHSSPQRTQRGMLQGGLDTTPSFRSQQDIGRHQPPVCLQVGRVCLCSFMFLEALLSHPHPKAPTPSQTHSMVHLRLKESHSPGQFHTLACRCSGHPPKGWGSCRWGRCPHGSSGWVAMLSLEGVPPGAAATAAPSGTRTDDTLGPSWCGLQWPQGFPVMTPRAEAH